MMHYKRGEKIEWEHKKEDLPFKDCFPNGQFDFLWMHVQPSTKVRNVITYAEKALESGEYRTIIWSGSGEGIVKTASCAEIMKRNHKLYQVTRMDQAITEEYWLPQMEGLEEIVVTRKKPILHILLSLNAIDENVEGFQKPDSNKDNRLPPELRYRGQRRGQQQQRQRYQQQQPQSQQQQQQRRGQQHYRQYQHHQPHDRLQAEQEKQRKEKNEKPNQLEAKEETQRQQQQEQQEQQEPLQHKTQMKSTASSNANKRQRFKQQRRPNSTRGDKPTTSGCNSSNSANN